MTGGGRARTLWLTTVGMSVAWSTLVIVHVLGNGLQSGICGAGLLETLQVLCVGGVWLPAHVWSYWARAQRRGDPAVELCTVLLALLAGWAQLQWEPACSAYM
jgi:hypothetical protein